MKTYANKLSDKFWNVILFIMKMFYYAVAAIIMFRLFQADWLVFMFVCIIIIILYPGYFKS